MNIGPKLKALVLSIRELFSRSAGKAGGLAISATKHGAARTLNGLAAAKRALVIIGVFGAVGYWLYQHPPIVNVGRGKVGVRTHLVTGAISEWREGSVFVMAGLHNMRIYSLRDHSYRPEEISRAEGSSPLQSVEGMSLGVDLAVRYALDPAKLHDDVASRLPDDVGVEIVQPAVNGVIYKIFARYTVRDIFSTKRSEIQQRIETELKNKLAADGVILRSVIIGKVDSPADYRRGMDALLAEELATEKMRYTLEFKDKRVKEIALDGEAEKVHREKAAEAAAREQIIAAKAQEEAMKHVLPFKQRQIEQRQLEAEADKITRIRGAEANAQSRRIEADGEAHARQKLTDAEVYRLEKVGKANAEQMEREGALITRHPLLVQKALADKLSDKIQVIIASPSTDGGFIGAALLGGRSNAPQATPHGVAFNNHERDGRVQICYDGDAFRRVLALASTPEQRDRAALALTRLECTGNESSPLERKRVNEWRAEVLDRVNIDELAGFQKNRVLLRRAALWSGLAYQRARLGEAGDVAAKQALSALSGIDKNQLTDADTPGYADAAMRVNASRWGAIPLSASTGKRLHIVTEAGAPGETCVLLLDKSNDSNHPLAKRCTYAIVWANSATINRENTALALAVQPTQTWRELWLFRKLGDEWSVHVLPPATTMPDVGYVEFAGWIPGGTQMLVAREASGEGKYRKSFEQISLDSLTTVRKASDPSLLSAFRRWQDAGWKAQTVSLC